MAIVDDPGVSEQIPIGPERYEEIRRMTAETLANQPDADLLDAFGAASCRVMSLRVPDVDGEAKQFSERLWIVLLKRLQEGRKAMAAVELIKSELLSST